MDLLDRIDGCDWDVDGRVVRALAMALALALAWSSACTVCCSVAWALRAALDRAWMDLNTGRCFGRLVLSSGMYLGTQGA